MPNDIPFNLADEDLENAFPPSYLERGTRYWRNGRVLTADYNAAQGLVSGRVRGSGGRVYQCVARLWQEAGGELTVVGQCSCPVGDNCKHVVATLLSLGGRSAQPSQSDASPALPPEVHNWLSQVEQAAAAGAAREDPQRLLYLLRCEERFGLQRILVQAVKVRRLVAGGYGKPQDYNISAQSRAGFTTPEDHRIMLLIEAGRDRVVMQPDTALKGETSADVLRAIALTGRGHWQAVDGPVLKLAAPLTGKLLWRLEEDTRLHLRLEADRPGLALLPALPPWYLDPATGECGPLETGLGAREASLLAMAPALTPQSVEALDEAAPAPLRSLALPLPSRTERRRVAAESPIPCLHLQSRDLNADHAGRYWGVELEPSWSHSAILTFGYGPFGAVDPRDRKETLERVEQGVLLESGRDLAGESAAIQTLEGLGLIRSLGDEEDTGLCFELPDDKAWLGFMGRDVPRLVEQGWQIRVEDGFHFRIAHLGDDWRIEIAEFEGQPWFDLGLGVEVDGERMDLLPLLVDLVQRYQADFSLPALAQMQDEETLQVRLDDGRLILMPAGRLRSILSTLIELYDPQRPLTGDGRLRLSGLQATQLAELEAADPRLIFRGGETAREWGQRLRGFQGLTELAPPTGLATELRPYQRRGLDWLQFLREYDLGGILADDMGLGKTVQALAHLLVEQEGGRADHPSLVVAPTSLMFNWQREAERFAPSLKVLLLHGPERRRRFAAIPDHDLVLTTYPLLFRDREALGAHAYHLLILDEAQAIKNPRSKAAQAAGSLEARYRLCLTGTPLENHLGELWSLFDFLLPELLGDERRFRRLFRTPIERYGDAHRQEQLRRRVTPFLLRRTKEAVATELPAKTEILRQVPLANDQRDLYETLRLAMDERVRQEVALKGLARSGIIILDALLKLRQVCCDPRLVALASARKVKGSAKLELLMTLLPELRDEGRRVLLFSQFTSMLALIEDELMRSGLRENQDFVKLTGRTRNRALPVDRFQAGEVPLFLISLKAGGSGLNLTAADTVIHYDPWWNPAAERQATDRAHRIGQDKPVFVYKLLTEGTVEQRVAELQARKQALADAMLAGGGAAAGSLTAEDLELLFAPIDKE
ncbi:DEAD/DEAH box helicase [Candidatus Thiosymbion oneisti]|uniref:DEAD/DEAH box helicase n=1 Tax=Candidatus Thiosymbion oneisti TaxID=589554 RepID=UPI000A9198DD|nr:DEAD/DEAH box helicase [Candidatus Thiosymbion oneisti]